MMIGSDFMAFCSCLDLETLNFLILLYDINPM